MTVVHFTSLKAAAEAAGVSSRTLQRRRAELIAAGASHDEATGWSIPVAALEEMGLSCDMSHDVAPDVSRVSRDTVAPVSPPADEVERLRAELADAEKRAAVAEAIAGERERERAELIRRAEAAEGTAREATAAAAALALTMKQLEGRVGDGTHEPAPPPAAEPAPEAEAQAGAGRVRSWVRGWRR